MDGWMKNELGGLRNYTTKNDEGSQGCLITLSVITITIAVTKYLYEKVPKWISAVSTYDLSLIYKIALFLIIAFTGFLFFRFKSKSQYYYGVCETSFALTSTWFACDKLFGSLQDKSLWLPVIGSVYLIVRGLSNIKDAKDKRKILNVSQQENVTKNEIDLTEQAAK
jgi:hypothetical protein